MLALLIAPKQEMRFDEFCLQLTQLRNVGMGRNGRESTAADFGTAVGGRLVKCKARIYCWNIILRVKMVLIVSAHPAKLGNKQ